MLKINELFSGIGSQNSALKRLGIEYEITTTSDLDTPAIISYAAIHCGLLDKLKDFDFPSGETMANYLLDRNIGWDFKENKPYNWKRFIDKKNGEGKKVLKKAYLATVLSNNAGDISKIEKLDYADLWTYSFPCQDISVAGKRAGIEEHTRSGLLYEVERLLNVSAEHGELPKYLLLENVKNLVGKQFKGQFDEWLEYLDELGYKNYWKVLNAKNYGIPQNRERVFVVSIRKDMDKGYEFPKGFDNGLRLKDFLEDEVDEKFYISQEKTGKLISQIKDGKKGTLPNVTDTPLSTSALSSREHRCSGWKETIGTLCARDYKDPKCVAIPCITPDREEKRQNGRRFKEDGEPMFTLTGQDRHGVLQVGNIVDTGNWNNPQRGRIYSAEGCSPALNTVGGGGLEPKILRPERTEYGKAIRKQYEAGEIQESRHNMTELQPREDGISNTLTTVQKDNLLLEPKILIDDTWSEKFGGTKTYRDYCPTLRSERTGLKVAVREATKQGYAEATVGDSINIQFPNSDTRRGRVGKEVAQTLETSCNQATLTHDYRIRKLTPKECWRLMGFTDEEFLKAEEVNSNSQLYKQAGNSIVVDVMEGICGRLVK